MKLVLPKAVDVRRLTRTDGRQDLVGYFLTLCLQSIDCLCHRNDVVEGQNICNQVIVEGLITMQRVTLDGTKIKAHASGNTFRRKEKIEAHLALARKQVQEMNAQAAEQEKASKRQSAAKRRAGRQRISRLEAAFREVERLQQSRKHDRDYVARASTTDPEAHVMRNAADW